MCRGSLWDKARMRSTNGLSILFACMAALLAFAGNCARAGEAPAMQGHASESKLRDAEAEAAHRRLFFDEALVEAGLPGVACDHRVASRPDVSAGTGSVHVVWRLSDGRVVARLWQAPGQRLTPAQLSARLDALVAATPDGAGRPALKTDSRDFAWCR
jgi:hypothetical protein